MLIIKCPNSSTDLQAFNAEDKFQGIMLNQRELWGAWQGMNIHFLVPTLSEN